MSEPKSYQSMYDAATIDRIWIMLGPSAGLSRQQFESDLKSAAWVYRGRREGLVRPRQPTASVRHRKLTSLAKRIGDARAALPDVVEGQQEYEALRSAALDLARTDPNAGPPGMNPTRFVASPEWQHLGSKFVDLWSIDEAFEVALRNLDWLAMVAAHTAGRAEAEKGPSGSRPDEAAHDFAVSLATLFARATGTAPRPPTYDPISETLRGAFFEFAAEAFLPVDGRGREAVAALLRRAVFANP